MLIKYHPPAHPPSELFRPGSPTPSSVCACLWLAWQVKFDGFEAPLVTIGDAREAKSFMGIRDEVKRGDATAAIAQVRRQASETAKRQADWLHFPHAEPVSPMVLTVSLSGCRPALACRGATATPRPLRWSLAGSRAAPRCTPTSRRSRCAHHTTTPSLLSLRYCCVCLHRTHGLSA